MDNKLDNNVYTKEFTLEHIQFNEEALDQLYDRCKKDNFTENAERDQWMAELVVESDEFFAHLDKLNYIESIKNIGMDNYDRHQTMTILDYNINKLESFEKSLSEGTYLPGNWKVTMMSIMINVEALRAHLKMIDEVEELFNEETAEEKDYQAFIDATEGVI